jgi:Zn-finger nucleic acid-binding protein
MARVVPPSAFDGLDCCRHPIWQRTEKERMNCPNDATTLVMSERSGIEIDYCPTCRGVWLDRGELDKIIERSNRDDRGDDRYRDDDRPRDDRSRDDRSRDDDRHREYPKKKKKSSFLSELFEGD